MRQAQRDYSKSRDQFNLRAAKRLEVEVDTQIRILTGKGGTDAIISGSADIHPKLF